jgi:hypothetical protein
MLVQLGTNYGLDFVCGEKLNQLIMAVNSQNASCCWYKYLSLLTKFSQKQRCSLAFGAFLGRAIRMLPALYRSQNATSCADNKIA